MWKTIQPGEHVLVGDKIRHQGLNYPSGTEVYQVVKEDQHYFEIIAQPGMEATSESDGRKVIRYIDIGYHLHIEKWTDPHNL